MGIALPQVITEDRASGAQIIDACLRFDSSKDQHLIRTPSSSSSDRKTWTWSAWVKRGDIPTSNVAQAVFGSCQDSTNRDVIRFNGEAQDKFSFQNGDSADYDSTTTNALLRDTSWYHVVVRADISNGTQSERIKIYVNGELQSSTTAQADRDTTINQNVIQLIGARSIDGSTGAAHWDGFMSQVYMIDGQALGPENFGFTDPLTNTWRPKKYTGTFGTNGFWLPMDGSAPIGQDQSGQGNDWTPVNFGGSVALDSPLVSGARPILNTTQGGTQAGVGVFGSKQNVGYAVTVYDDGGGNKYYIDGVKQATLTGLIRGATYTFDTSDSTVSSHPFRFSATSNGSHGGGSEYTNGVAAITGTATTITVPHDAPNTLYYYCTSHSGMGADITGITTNEKLADKYASNCVIALPSVGLIGSGGTLLGADVSDEINVTSTEKPITSIGNAHSSTDRSNFYGGSFEFDGTGDWVISSSSSDLAFGTGDFTIECWVFQTSAASAEDGIFQISDNNLGISNTNSNTVTLQTNSGAYRIYANDTSTAMSTKVITDQWVHLAVVRDSGTTKLFVNGNQDATTISDSRNYSGTYLAVGGYYSSSYLWVGYIQDFRVYKGVAKYTSNFVPAATSPDILPDTPSGVSGSSKLAKITDGAVSFDGTGDYLSLTTNTDFAYGTGDFTIEFFTYLTKTGQQHFYEGRDGGSSNRLLINTNGSTKVAVYANGGYVITGQTLLTKKWYHIAFSRSGTSSKLFVDGVQSGSTYSDSINYAAPSGSLYLGIDDTPSGSTLGGFLSNYRVIKGTALYTSNFTPPTRALTNVTNTKLLCCQSNTSAESSTVISNIADFYSAGVYLTATTYIDRGGSSCTVTNNGSITSSSAGTNSFGLTTAADVTGQQLIELNMGNVSGTFFQSEWTLEMFFKKDASEDNWFVGTSTSGASYTTGWSIDAQGGSLRWNYDNQGGVPPIDTGIAIGNNTWYFMRVQRTPSTSQSRFYIEVYDSPTNRIGAFEGTAQDGASHSNNILKIGDANGNSNNLSANFQFANVMITAGTRRNQTVPTLSSGQRVLNTTVTGTISAYGDTAPTTFNPFITDINAVRGQETGYATLNPLDKASAFTLSNGNLTASVTDDATACAKGTLATPLDSGKWFWEFLYEEKPSGGGTSFGAVITTASINAAFHTNAAGYGYYSEGDYVRKINNNSQVAYGTDFVPGDIIGVALDLDNSEITFYKNGASQGVAYSSIASGSYTPAISSGTNTGTAKGTLNCGQKPFKFPPPDGFQPLNTANTRPVKVIARPDQFVGTVIYTGNQTARTESVNFAPDFVWTKRRDDSNSHQLYDSVRGDDKIIQTDSTGGETTVSNSLSFAESKGINIGSGTRSNENSVSYVAWAWKAGGSKNTFNVDDVGYASAAAAGLDGGDITPTGASVGTKQGFSIVSYSGATNATTDSSTNSGNPWTIPHGLGQKPAFMIFKNRSAHAWYIYHQSFGATKHLLLNNTTTAATGTVLFRDTEPTSDFINVGGWDVINRNSNNYISYIWHDVPGLQKFGSYIGTGAAPNYVHLGFRPALVIIKNAGTNGSPTNTNNWLIQDSTRFTSNPIISTLYPNRDDQEATEITNFGVDFLSDGFALRTTSGYTTNSNNASEGHTFIYAAWAEAPTVNLYGGQSNAR